MATAGQPYRFITLVMFSTFFFVSTNMMIFDVGSPLVPISCRRLFSLKKITKLLVHVKDELTLVGISVTVSSS